jgi:hypothetical protein
MPRLARNPRPCPLDLHLTARLAWTQKIFSVSLALTLVPCTSDNLFRVSIALIPLTANSSPIKINTSPGAAAILPALLSRRVIDGSPSIQLHRPRKLCELSPAAGWHIFFSFKKPMAITAFSIVTKDNWPLFVPFNSSTRMPPGAPCSKWISFIPLLRRWRCLHRGRR